MKTSLDFKDGYHRITYELINDHGDRNTLEDYIPSECIKLTKGYPDPNDARNYLLTRKHIDNCYLIDWVWFH